MNGLEDIVFLAKRELQIVRSLLLLTCCILKRLYAEISIYIFYYNRRVNDDSYAYKVSVTKMSI